MLVFHTQRMIEQERASQLRSWDKVDTPQTKQRLRPEAHQNGARVE